MSAIAEDFRYQISDNRLKSLCAKGFAKGSVHVFLIYNRLLDSLRSSEARRRLPRRKAPRGRRRGQFKADFHLRFARLRGWRKSNLVLEI